MTQVSPGFYNCETYDTRQRWLSYWYQIQAINRAKPKSILEIGCGQGLLSHYLRHNLGINVTTIDIDTSLMPDITGDVRLLRENFEPNSFDLVCAFQVLEHIPFDEFIPALRQMREVSRETVLLSLPHCGYNLHVRLWLKNHQFAIGRRVTPFKPSSWVFNGQHYWEIGASESSLKRVVSMIRSVLKIKTHYFCPDYPYHYFFECHKKN